jgi:DHA3 family multidrug efflux protein-like MFS transporter
VKRFYNVLVNTLIANVTTSYLWFALTFWVYLETESVLATSIIGGAYFACVAIFSLLFGTIVDKNKKKNVMVGATAFTLGAYVLAGIVYMLFPRSDLSDYTTIGFWLFTLIILLGGVVEMMRNIALSTTVTLLVPEDKRANANGLVGTVQGLAFLVTSVFSGLSIGLVGMGWTLVIAVTLTAVALIHIAFVRIPEKGIAHDPELANKRIDLKGSMLAIKVVPGLLALILFSTFNNFLGGAYIALMDPYGLTLFPVEIWGIVLGVTSAGFIIGGLLVAKKGLGKNPIRTMLLINVAMSILGMTFTIRELWWLYVVGILLYMVLIPIVEAAEQTIIQKVVPYKRQGRVFGFAQAIESAAAPITSFAIGPIAEFILIPYMNSAAGKSVFGWLLGEGDARGIALIFLFAGLIGVVVTGLAFLTKSYRILSDTYAKSHQNPSTQSEAA